MSDLVHVSSGASVTLLEILGFSSDTSVPTVVHQVIGSGQPDFSLQPAGPRTGTWRFLCDGGPSATVAQNLLRRPGIFAVTEADASFANLAFYVSGVIRYTLDEETRRRVVLEVEFTEVT